MTRNERAAQLWAILVLAARNRQILTYNLVARAIGAPTIAIGGFLGPVQAYCMKAGLPGLTSLVVNSDTGMPGAGFIAAKNVLGEQARVFEKDWLKLKAPTTEELESAYKQVY